jgi:hypothetical protein
MDCRRDASGGSLEFNLADFTFADGLVCRDGVRYLRRASRWHRIVE